MVQNSVSAVCTLTGVIIRAVAVGIKLNAQINKRAYHVLRRLNHNPDSFGIILVMSGFHCILKIAIKVVNIFKHAHTALCEP